MNTERREAREKRRKEERQELDRKIEKQRQRWDLWNMVSAVIVTIGYVCFFGALFFRNSIPREFLGKIGFTGMALAGLGILMCLVGKFVKRSDKWKIYINVLLIIALIFAFYVIRKLT